ncbi:MAG: DUF167 domain-containing protein [Candidatus Omnitrophica bacterium]|nr:DUF167 domain-containing protein [Candidatus Omnitrophota bacterium]
MAAFTIEVRVVPGSSQRKVLALESRRFKVYLHEKAVEGEANEALRIMLGEYFKVPKSAVRFLRGEKSKNKVIEIHETAKN